MDKSVFHIYVSGSCVDGGSQQITFARDEVSNLADIKQTLQSELCFVNPLQSTICSMSYQSRSGEYLLLESFPTNLQNGSRYASSQPAATNPIHLAALQGDVSANVRITTEANPLAPKDAFIFEAITRMCLQELLGGAQSSQSLVNVLNLIQDVRLEAADNLSQSVVELLKSASFSRLQTGLAREVQRASAKTSQTLGSVLPIISPAALSDQIMAAAVPTLYRQTALRKLGLEANAQAASYSPARANAGDGKPSSAPSGSALYAVRSSAAPQQANTPSPPTRNKAAAPSSASRNKSAYNDDADAAADTTANQSAGGGDVRSAFAKAINYNNAASSIAAARRVPATEAPPPASALRQNSSYNEVSTGGRVPSSAASFSNLTPVAPSLTDTMTIYCVYSGATSQRAKAIQVNRKNPGFDVLMQTLKYKFGAELVLGYIDPHTGECSEVLNNDELKTLISHCDRTDSLTLQCWAKNSIKFDADIVDTDFERQMAAADFTQDDFANNTNNASAAANGQSDDAGGPQRNKSARPTSAARGRIPSEAPTNANNSSTYNINSNPLAPKPAVWEEYTRSSNQQRSTVNNYDTRALLGNNSNSNTPYRGNTVNSSRGSQYQPPQQQQRPTSAILEQVSARGNGAVTTSYMNTSNPARLTPSALSQFDPSPAQHRSSSPLSARSGGRNKSANPSRPASRMGGAMSTTSSRYGGRGGGRSKPSFTPSYKLDVSGTAWNEQQLRELFDSFDKDGSGCLDREEMMEYFYTYHDDMGIVDAKNKFVEMLNSVPEFQDGKLSFDEFAIIMLKIAQW